MPLFQKSHFSKELEALKKSILKDSGHLPLPQKEEAEKPESILITYSLDKKSRSKKMLFNYEIMGRNGKEGLLQKLGGKKFMPGCVIIPKETGNEMENFLNKREVAFSKQKIMLLD